jgi:ATP-dependent Lhr-like helicase
MDTDQLLPIAEGWFAQKEWQAFAFQQQTWRAYLAGQHGVVNAPTGSGKTYALLIPILLEFIRSHPDNPQKKDNGLQAIWITPIKALAREIEGAAKRAIEGLGLNWEVGIRSGDTETGERSRQKKKPPELLITTPESLHLLLATKGYPQFFEKLQTVVIDEWHELLGSKRGVQMELALSRFKSLCPQLKVWGISATIGNMEEAVEVLLGNSIQQAHQIIRADLPKQIQVESVLPNEIEKFPWTGHLGIQLLHKVLPLIEGSNSTLIFTNTRAQCEIWYQQLLEVAPDLAGAIAMHHGSISRELRDWVENGLHDGILKAVVCTSSLDLGVDFRPVETIIQVGSAKGVARFTQRAGRSGHQPGAVSKIYFVPTHSLELLEGAALRNAIAAKAVESRTPYIRTFDVLIQYLITLAVSDGFFPQDILPEVRGTFCFNSISDEEWAWALDFISSGGQALYAYEEYKKVEIEAGFYQVKNRRVAMWHRLQIGTIVSDSNLQVKFVSGGYIGSVEEWFIGQLKPGDVFWFAGRSLELVRIKEMTVQVRLSTKKTGKVPAWMGGRLPLSSQLSAFLRDIIDGAAKNEQTAVEVLALAPLLELQAERSHIPEKGELLMEYFQSKEGYHWLIYPFEGRSVHEGMSALVAYRIAQLQPITFSIAMNDYGFELLSDAPIPWKEALESGLFSVSKLSADIRASINATELAKRRFRDIASIAGLVFKGYPGKQKKDRHVQASAQLFFQVFNDYEPNNLLLLQAYEEVMTFQLEEERLRSALLRIQGQRLVLRKPTGFTPFSFPIIVDRLRERLSSEKLADRIKRMTAMRFGQYLEAITSPSHTDQTTASSDPNDPSGSWV